MSTITSGPSQPSSEIELSIVMPCLNEAETLATCIRKAQGFLSTSGVVGEIVIADNGSSDGSQDIALAEGARVVEIEAKGYGSALLGGVRASRGTYVIMGDADDSYDFTNLQPFVDELRGGADVVMGNRFAGGIAAGAMPPLHKYLGNPVLSFIGRLFFKTTIRDFHCGLRGFRREPLLALNLHTTGMEFASEIVVRSTLAGQVISEVPTTLSRDGRSRPPHLRSFRDGWRHLRFLLMFAPRWVFLYPGSVAAIAGAIGVAALIGGPKELGGLVFDLGTLGFSTAALLIGSQSVIFWLLFKVYAIGEGFLPGDERVVRFVRWASLERSLILGLILFVGGLAIAGVSVVNWSEVGLGRLDVGHQVRLVMAALIGLVIGAQVVFNSIFLSLLTMGRARLPAISEPIGA